MSKLYTVKEAAEMLSVSKVTMYRWLAAQEIDHIRLGGRRSIRISQEHIDAFLAKRDERQGEKRAGEEHNV